MTGFFRRNFSDRWIPRVLKKDLSGLPKLRILQMRNATGGSCKQFRSARARDVPDNAECGFTRQWSRDDRGPLQLRKWLLGAIRLTGKLRSIVSKLRKELRKQPRRSGRSPRFLEDQSRLPSKNLNTYEKGLQKFNAHKFVIRNSTVHDLAELWFIKIINFCDRNYSSRNYVNSGPWLIYLFTRSNLEWKLFSNITSTV